MAKNFSCIYNELEKQEMEDYYPEEEEIENEEDYEDELKGIK